MTHQWVCFNLGNEKYAHSIQSIGEILRYNEPTPIPGSPLEVEGVMNVRGEIITILSGRNLLGLAANSSKPRHILTLTASCAVSVDCVEEIISLENSEIDYETQSDANTLIKGTAQHDHTLLILIDFLPCCRSGTTSE